MTRRSAALWISLGLLAGCKAEAPQAPPAAAPATSELTSAPASTETAASADTVKGTQTLSGTFVGFEAGDYLHGVFALSGAEKGSEKRSFFLERGMEIFLVDHASEPLELEVQTVETEIPEAGGRMEIERLHAIRAGTVTFTDWWKTAEPSFGKLLDEYQAQIDKATLAPEDVPAEGS